MGRLADSRPAPSGWPGRRRSLTLVVGLLVIGLLVMGILVVPVDADAVEELTLAAPLTTIITASTPLPSSATGIHVELDLPDGAPSDLGANCFVCDDDGQWFQSPRLTTLIPGATTRIDADLAGTPWRSEPGRACLSPARRSVLIRYGVFIWSASTHHTRVTPRLSAIMPTPGGAPPEGMRLAGADAVRLDELAIDGLDQDGVAHAQTGQRWSLRLRPHPFPGNPYDPALFRLDCAIVGPQGFSARLAGFYDSPLALSDGGDREVSTADGDDRFLVRFRPRLPGHYDLTLIACWSDGSEHRYALPALEVGGAAWDEILHRDADDPRFFSSGPTGAATSRFVWPVGINLASPGDTGAAKDYQTHLTPDRGSLAYGAYFARMGAVGATAAEIWLSSWNLGLEWNRSWRGYHGIGRYNERNAARLDRILDLAWEHHVRLVLNLNNHGQYIAPPAGESEWIHNPYNQANGGPLIRCEEVFSDPGVIASQDRLRRYMAARYADHPAVLTWKLFSEVDLTNLGIACIRAGAGGMETLRGWHDHAAGDWHRLDIYHHPVTTHVATTYMNADPRLFSSPELDVVGLDAYYAPGVYTHAGNLSELMVDTMLDPYRGCRALHKAVIVTEYGGGWHELNRDKLGIEHRSGAWLALTTGEAASPMLWWHEWVDQHDQWQPYLAISRFIDGEDLRGANAESQPLDATSSDGRVLWGRAWIKRGIILGYLQDARWAHEYAPQPAIPGGVLILGEEVAAGRMSLSWWNADSGESQIPIDLDHHGGRLQVDIPPFTSHIAFKLKRLH